MDEWARLLAVAALTSIADVDHALSCELADEERDERLLDLLLERRFALQTGRPFVAGR
jgi:hypothetical protein